MNNKLLLPLESHVQLLPGNTSHAPPKHECSAALMSDKLLNIQSMTQYDEQRSGPQNPPSN